MTHTRSLLVHTQTNLIADLIWRGAIVEEVNDRWSKDMDEDGALTAKISGQVGAEQVQPVKECSVIDIR